MVSLMPPVVLSTFTMVEPSTTVPKFSLTVVFKPFAMVFKIAVVRLSKSMMLSKFVMATEFMPRMAITEGTVRVPIIVVIIFGVTVVAAISAVCTP
jgi:hypothetical protein